MRLIFALFIIVFFASCKKQRLSTFKGTSYLKGNYEWVYSYSLDDNESESFETIPDHYALKFKKSGTVEVFKNGERVSKGYVSNLGGVYEGTRSVYLQLEGEVGNADVRFIIDDETIEFRSYPINEHVNIFQKQ